MDAPKTPLPLAPLMVLRFLTIAVLLSLAPAAGHVAAAPPSADWPRWHGPNNDGVSPESGWSTDWPAEGPKVLWKINVGVGFSSVAVVSGRVFTMGNTGGKDIVWCLDAGTGKEIWTHKYPCKVGGYKGTRATPTVDGELVYTLSREGDLFCLAAADGSVRWSKKVTKDFGVKPSSHGWGIACSPLVLGKSLILALGKTLALDKETGELLWSSGDYEAGFSSATTMKLDGKTYINSFNAYGLAVVDASRGKEVANYEWETNYKVNAASPIASGNEVFISSGYGKGCALLKLNDGALSPVYKNRNMRNHCNSCVLYKGHLYGLDGQMGSRAGKLACLDFKTGEVLWAKKGLRPGGLMVAGGKIVAMLDKGELLIAEATPEAYKPLARATILSGRCWTYPVLCGGRIYCRSNEAGELACVDVRR